MPLHAPRRSTSLVLACGGGLAADAGFPGLGWWPLTFVAIAALFYALARDSARWNTVVGLVFGIAFFVPHLSWIDGAVGVVPWLALSLTEAAFVALMGAAWAWARRGVVIWSSSLLQVPTFAVLWVGLEEARSVMPFGGFPWGRLAFAHAVSPLGRYAWAGGVPLVSGMVVVVGVILALALGSLRRLDIAMVSVHVLVASAILFGGWLLPLDSAPQDGRLMVGAVQGNVPDRGLDSFSQAREVLQNHVEETRALADEVDAGDLDIVLWPENASDVDPTVDADAASSVRSAARAVDAPILIGTDHFPESGGRLNTALLWDPVKGPVSTYAKRHPAPFAEYIPMRDFARKFSSDVDRVRIDMIPGDKVGIIDLDSERLDRVVPIGVAICFEVGYDEMLRDAVQAGAEFLVIPTNNATFGVTDESTQQLAMSQLRAIELGRATVQISTVGVSAVISPSGIVSQRTTLFTAQHMVAQIPLRTERTPATTYGGALAWVIRALAGLTVIAGMAGAARVSRIEREGP